MANKIQNKLNSLRRLERKTPSDHPHYEGIRKSIEHHEYNRGEAKRKALAKKSGKLGK